MYWMLRENAIGSYSEVYLSFYEYTESQARFNDEYTLARFQPDGSAQDLIIPWMWTSSFNATSATLEMVVEGGNTHGHFAGIWDVIPVGGWVQWEFHLRPNTPGLANGFLRLYKNGNLYLSTENAQLFDGSWAGTNVQAGGYYTKIVWMTDYPTCSVPSGCSSAPAIGTDLCVVPEGWAGQPFDDPICNPIDPPLPNFRRYIDDVIVMTQGGVSPPVGDTSPPYVASLSPASGDTNIAATNKTIAAHVLDYESGVSLSSIRMAVGKNGGAKTEWTCANGLTCTGTSSDYSVTRTMASDWTAGDTVQVLINASDLASPSNTMSPYSYSYSIAAAATGGPYPASTLITGINWQFTSMITGAGGSDLWPMTWAGDNNTYTTWGDGGGFGGDDTKCRTQFGMAKITNSPPSALTTTNVLGCKSDNSGCIGTFTHDAACNASYANTFSTYGSDILAIDNTLFSIGWSDDSAVGERISYSTNFGQTWTQNSWSWPRSTGSWVPISFVKYGKGYLDNTFGYVVGVKEGDWTHTYLARYPRGGSTPFSVLTSFQWFTGTTSTPSWGSWGNATPIHTDSTGENGGHMTFFPVLNRYILMQSHGGVTAYEGMGEIQKLAVYESANPWGPWYTVAYYNTWAAAGTSNALWYSVNPKWISADNKTFWVSWSGGSQGSISQDGFHLVRGDFVLAGGIPPPTGVTIGSYFYGPYLYGTMY
jgi:hypothetical protein